MFYGESLMFFREVNGYKNLCELEVVNCGKLVFVILVLVNCINWVNVVGIDYIVSM